MTVLFVDFLLSIWHFDLPYGTRDAGTGSPNIWLEWLNHVSTIADASVCIKSVIELLPKPTFHQLFWALIHTKTPQHRPLLAIKLWPYLLRSAAPVIVGESNNNKTIEAVNEQGELITLIFPTELDCITNENQLEDVLRNGFKDKYHQNFPILFDQQVDQPTLLNNSFEECKI